MAGKQTLSNDPKVIDALDELRAIIVSRYPTATFDVFHRDGPCGVRLRARVDVEDLDEVIDAVIDKLYEVQVERELPVYVVAAHPPGYVEPSNGFSSLDMIHRSVPALPRSLTDQKLTDIAAEEHAQHAAKEGLTQS